MPAESNIPGSGGIMRPMLHRILSDEIRARGAQVQLGITVDAIKILEDGEHVRFSDHRIATYDLVIGADGIGSRMRTRRTVTVV